MENTKRHSKFHRLSKNDPIGIAKFRYVSEILRYQNKLKQMI